MRKIAIIFRMFILCSIAGFTQNKIDKSTFEKLVDYANCKYTAAYIETFRTDPKEKGNIEKYDINVKEKLTSCTAEKPASFAELSNLLKSNGWAETESKLSAAINDKKKNFEGNEMEADDAIGLLKLEGTFADILPTAVNDLQKELTAKYKQQPSPIEEKTEKQLETNPVQTVETITTPNTEHSHKVIWGALVLTWLILIVLTGLFFLFRKKIIKPTESDREKIIKTILKSNRVTDKFVSNDIIKSLRERINYFEGKISELNNAIANLQKQENGFVNNISGIATHAAKYLKGKSGNTFSNISDTPDGSFFKLVNEKDGTAEFEYCGSIADARSQFNAIFDNICRTEGSAQNAKTLKTAKRGKVKFADGKWVVTEENKAIIKFE